MRRAVPSVLSKWSASVSPVMANVMSGTLPGAITDDQVDPLGVDPGHELLMTVRW